MQRVRTISDSEHLRILLGDYRSALARYIHNEREQVKSYSTTGRRRTIYSVLKLANSKRGIDHHHEVFQVSVSSSLMSPQQVC